jgi:hypothetical protein
MLDFRLGKLNIIYMKWGTGFSACGEGDMGRLSAMGFHVPRFEFLEVRFVVYERQCPGRSLWPRPQYHRRRLLW